MDDFFASFYYSISLLCTSVLRIPVCLSAQRHRGAEDAEGRKVVQSFSIDGVIVPDDFGNKLHHIKLNCFYGIGKYLNIGTIRHCGLDPQSPDN